MEVPAGWLSGEGGRRHSPPTASLCISSLLSTSFTMSTEQVTTWDLQWTSELGEHSCRLSPQPMGLMLDGRQEVPMNCEFPSRHSLGRRHRSLVKYFYQIYHLQEKQGECTLWDYTRETEKLRSPPGCDPPFFFSKFMATVLSSTQPMLDVELV